MFDRAEQMTLLEIDDAYARAAAWLQDRKG
jgi:hypothetical protein